MQAYMQDRGRDDSAAFSENDWDPYGKRKDQLCTHAYSRPHRGEREKLVVRKYMKYLILLGAIVLCSLVIVGCSTPSLAIEYFGLVGAALNSSEGMEDPVNRYSIFGLTNVLMAQGSFLGTGRDALGWGGPSTLVILTVLIVPLLQAVALLTNWFSPLTGRARKKLSVILEILQAWQYTEVYIIAFFVASWQMAPLSEWMFNSYCNELNEMLTNLVYYGFLDNSHGQCFQVQATVQNGAYYLVVGVVLLALLNTYVMKASEQYFRDRHTANEKWQPRRVVVDAAPAMTTVSLEQNTKTVYEGEKPTDDGIFRSNAELECEVASIAATEELNVSWEEEDDRYDAEKKIHPIPLLFTDRFRWTLRREVQHHSSRALQAAKLEKMFILADGLFSDDDKKESSISNDAHDALPQATLVGVEDASLSGPRSGSFRSQSNSGSHRSTRSLLSQRASVRASIISDSESNMNMESVSDPRSSSFPSQSNSGSNRSHRSLLSERSSARASNAADNASDLNMSSELMDRTQRPLASVVQVQPVDQASAEDGSVGTVESGVTSPTADMTFLTGATSFEGGTVV